MFKATTVPVMFSLFGVEGTAEYHPRAPFKMFSKTREECGSTTLQIGRWEIIYGKA